METKGGVDGSRVWLPEEIKEKLEKLKVHHRQAYYEVIDNLAKEVERQKALIETEQLSDFEIFDAACILLCFNTDREKERDIVEGFRKGQLSLRDIIDRIGAEKIPKCIIDIFDAKIGLESKLLNMY